MRTERQTLRGHVLPAIRDLNLTAIGRPAATTNLHLAIGLPLRNRELLHQLLQQLYDPASPNYHRYLTPAQFTEMFGPTEQDYQAVIAFAKANRLTVTATHPNRVVLDVAGTVADIEQALHVTLRTYQHPTEARTFHAPDTEPSLDFATTVLDISGLDNFSLPRPMSKLRPAATVTPRAGSGPSGSYRGKDFRAAYVPGTALTGAGQNVGLVQFDGYYYSDITNYIAQAGITTSVVLTNVAVDGGVSNPGGGNSEVCLDIEMVISMAPGVSKIFVYEAPLSSPWVDILSRMANDNIASQLSCSWGGGSVDRATAEQIFIQMAVQGQTFFNASGDSDAFTAAIPFPSDSTNVVQVGGTTLTTAGPGSNYVSETVWNWGLYKGKYWGSGGGISTYYAIPYYQLGIDMTANQGSTTWRNVPDIALTADDVWVAYNNGSSGVFGGTSCAAPLWAAFTALVNQQGAANGLSPVGFLNPALYNIGKGTNYTACFHDTTTGNNFSSSSPTNFSAVAGYDLCTGWGTPNGTNLINTLAPNVRNVVSAGTALLQESFVPTNGLLDAGESVTFNFSFRNAGTITVTNLIATLLATNGVVLPSPAQTYGTLDNGDPAVTRPFSFIVSGNCGDIITATLQLQDGLTDLGTVTYNFRIGQLISSTTFTENFDTVTAPALPSGWTTSANGAESDWVTSTNANDSAPNAANAPDPNLPGLTELVSPAIFISSSSAQLTFRHFFDLENDVNSRITAYDVGVLEIKIGAGSFSDILSAGGSFVAGGYNAAVAVTDNPLPDGRQVWSGNSGGFITTTVNLPTNAANQTIQLKWICATDSGNYGGRSYEIDYQGWYIDTISIAESHAVCASYLDLAITATSAPNPVAAGYHLAGTFTVTNKGSLAATSVTVTNTLPPTATFLSATTSQGTVTNTTNLLIANLGVLATNTSATIQVLTAIPSAATGTATNLATVAAAETDPVPADNTATILTAILTDTDQDGIPDVWMNTYFGQPTGPAGDDADGDGMTNLQEYLAGTSPTDSLNVLRITSVVADGNDFAVTFPSVTGKLYAVERNDDLTNPAGWAAIQTNIPGTGSPVTITDPGAASQPRYFYRVRLLPPP